MAREEVQSVFISNGIENIFIEFLISKTKPIGPIKVSKNIIKKLKHAKHIKQRMTMY